MKEEQKELVLTKEMRELLKQVIINGKRIDELERKINGLMKDIEGDYKKVFK